jgi:hypothetical protein
MAVTMGKEFVNLDAKPVSSISETNLAYDMARASVGLALLRPYSPQDRLRPGSSQRIMFKVSAGPGTLWPSLEGLMLTPGSKVGRFSELPAEDRKGVEELKSRFRASLGGGVSEKR